MLNVAIGKPGRGHKIEIIEWYDSDCRAVTLNAVVDGDTVIADSASVRIAGYDAYELSEGKGEEVKRVLKEILKGRRARLDVDDLEPRGKCGRTSEFSGPQRIRRPVPLPKPFLLR